MTFDEKEIDIERIGELPAGADSWVARKLRLVRFGPMTLLSDKRERKVHLTGHKEKSSLRVRLTSAPFEGVYTPKKKRKRRGFGTLTKGSFEDV